MINPDRLTVKSAEALNEAIAQARRAGNPLVYDLHLLSALLSQTLVAFTLEFDNEFERRISADRFRGVGLSLNVWSNLLQYLKPEGMQVGELMAAAFGDADRIVATLGCLERWRYVTLNPASADAPLP